MPGKAVAGAGAAAATHAARAAVLCDEAALLVIETELDDVIGEKTPRKDLYQSFYLLRFSVKTQKKWDRMLQALPPALPEESPAQDNPVSAPSTAGR